MPPASTGSSGASTVSGHPPPPAAWHNWSSLETAYPSRRTAPRCVEDVVESVTSARRDGLRVKMPGTGHSFTGIAVADGVLLSPERLSGFLEIDRERMTATVLAGTPLKVLNAQLEAQGLSLHNMGDIMEQTVAGATQTGTHGTGGHWASLAAQLDAVEMVTGTGETLRASATENPEVFAAARVGLGALGILTSLTFRVEPLFRIEAQEGPMSWEETLSRFDELDHDNHYFETYWFPHTDRMLVKQNNRTLDDADPLPRWRYLLDDELLSNGVFGAMTALGERVPTIIPHFAQVAARGLSARTYTDNAYRVFTSPRRVVFREMEYAVPREVGIEALREARRLIERRGWRISFPVEIRIAPADDIALSTASGRDSVYLAFHVPAGTDHTAYFTEVERLLVGYGGRPHWGKLHTRTASDLAVSYPGFEEFTRLRDRLDPDRIFTNDYLDRVLGS